MPKGKNQHVVPHTNGWAVTGDGNTRASRTFDNKEEAVAFARERAKKNQAELIVHGKDGAIQQRNTYGKDPHPPRG